MKDSGYFFVLHTIWIFKIIFYPTVIKNKKIENLESLRNGMYEYIEIWYNNSRIHSKIGFTSPNEYEESIKKGNEKIA